VTAGHCTFAVGLDSVSTTTEEDRLTAADGNGTGGNDVWFTTTEDGSKWNGWPLTFDENGDLNYPTKAKRSGGPGPWREARKRRRHESDRLHPQLRLELGQGQAADNSDDDPVALRGDRRPRGGVRRVRLSHEAYAHGLALALPQEVEVAPLPSRGLACEVERLAGRDDGGDRGVLAAAPDHLP
jgi:hypothetical protein